MRGRRPAAGSAGVWDVPALRAAQELQGRITALENVIADQRELYNESVNINNVKIERFPDALVARLFNFEAKPPLEFASADPAYATSPRNPAQAAASH